MANDDLERGQGTSNTTRVALSSNTSVPLSTVSSSHSHDGSTQDSASGSSGDLTASGSSSLNENNQQDNANAHRNEGYLNDIEGYPRFSSYLASHPDLQILNRFEAVRMRMLLYKQDRISQLVAELNRLDKKDLRNDQAHRVKTFRLEPKDRNLERDEVFKQLDSAFKDHDDFLQRLCWVASQPDTTLKKVQSLKHWIGTKGFPARDDMEYLDANVDHLMLFGHIKDSGMAKLVPFAEGILVAIEKGRRKVFAPKTTPTMDIARPTIRAVARVIAASLTIFVLLVPILILNFVDATAIKFVVIFIAATAFVSGVTAASLASMADIFVAGATYAAVLVVFVSQNGVGDSGGGSGGGNGTSAL